MSSILTNTSAMVALQTLNGINKNLSQVQSEISTGKSVASAKDNSAVWAISQVMQSDVDGFNAISDSLSLGQSTVAVGRNAAESVTNLLSQVKEKIVAAQEDNVDREKLQTDLASLRDQISGIVGAAQFNGQNLLSNTETTAGSGSVDILASLDRAADGSVSSSNISVGKQDLGTGASAVSGTAQTTGGTMLTGTAAGTATTVTGNTATPATTTATVSTANAGEGFAIVIAAGAGGLSGVNTTAGNGTELKYVARDGDTVTDVADNLVKQFNSWITDNGGTADDMVASNVAGVITFTGGTTGSNASIRVDGYAVADTTIGGGLEDLGTMDISTAAGAASALSDIEALTQTAINAAAEFGTGEKRLEIQADFVSKLTDSLKAGIGALVDANMEEASAKLQALQVQQQLGIQSLSIANQAPQSVLSLFR